MDKSILFELRGMYETELRRGIDYNIEYQVMNCIRDLEEIKEVLLRYQETWKKLDDVNKLIQKGDNDELSERNE